MVTPKRSARAGSSSTSGAPPFSHLLTAWADTPASWPSCSWVRPRALRSSAMRSLNTFAISAPRFALWLNYSKNDS